MNDNPNEQNDLTEEEFLELVLAEKDKALAEARERRLNGPLKPKKKRPIVKLIILIMSIILIFNTFAIIFNMYSIPAIEFLQVSSKLSVQEDIKTYKKAVVTVSSDSSKGTGFAISADGFIVTNEHVIDDALSLTVVFPDEGLFEAEVIATYEDIDLALLKVSGDDLPYLDLAATSEFEQGDMVYFIGNPLYFTGIANKGTLLASTTATEISGDVMMMDAPVYKGNSGSPVITKDGQVIGVVFATGTRDDYGKVGLFIPIEQFHERFTKFIQ